MFDKLVYGKLRAALGGNCVAAVSGGAPLGARLGHFFRGIGVTIYEGYGLTETTAGVTVNRPDAIKIGTVGRPVGGTTVRVAEDGELLFKAPHIFRGYWKNQDATAEALDADGWFHTGDIGEIDDDGFVRITGRKKELIVTAGGKNVAPAVLEDRVRAHWLVSQCLVVGDQKPFIAALVTIDPESFPTLAGEGRQAGRHPAGRRRRRRRAARRDPDRDRRRQQGGQQGRVDPQVHDPGRGLDRGGRPAHAVAEAQAQRRAQGEPSSRSTTSTPARRRD